MTLDRLKERFEIKFTKGSTNECWIWRGRVDGYGFGRIDERKVPMLAHRLAYQFYVGEIPKGMFVLHNCHNNGCVNPDHLCIGTQMEKAEMRKATRKTMVEIFKEKVIEKGTDECWEWEGSRLPSGYGTVGNVGGKSTYAHRMAYEVYVGVIPDGYCVCHHCDNPSCVNPKHLFVGTNKDNAHDCAMKGRHKYISHPGTDNGRAKLSVGDVLAIRESTGTLKELAEKYGVTSENIHHIRKGNTWKCVT